MRLLIECSCESCRKDRRRIRVAAEFDAKMKAISGAKMSTTRVKRAGSWGVEPMPEPEGIKHGSVLPRKWYPGAPDQSVKCVACGMKVGEFYRTGHVPTGQAVKHEIIPVIMPDGALVLETKTRVFEGAAHGPLCDDCATNPRYRIDARPFEHIPAREFDY